MTDYRIWPLRTGTIVVDKGQYVTRGIDVGTRIGIPATAWYLTDGRRHMLVDTGMCHTELAHWHHPGSEQGPDEAVHHRLEAMGVDPLDIDLIIFTHLHWDHCHNIAEFPNARLVASKAEIAFARDPLPIYFKSYEHERLSKQAPFIGHEFDAVEGEVEIERGITVFPTPGHSPGHQSVAVSTTGGVHVITGDACFAYVNLEPLSETLPFTIMGRAMDLQDAWRSLEGIVDRADVVLPAHDDAVYDHESYPADGAPRNVRPAGGPS